MTKDETAQLAQMAQKLDDFISTTKPILDALNGPAGWFARMETRVTTQENRNKMIFAIFGGAWALLLVIVAALAGNFDKMIQALQRSIAAKP